VVKWQDTKGVLNLDPKTSPFKLVFDGDRFTGSNPSGESKGKVIVAKGGRLDMVTDKMTVPCTYQLRDGRLTLIIWPNTAARDKGGDPIKSGAAELTLERF
jgi:hypothetical protein